MIAAGTVGHAGLRAERHSTNPGPVLRLDDVGRRVAARDMLRTPEQAERALLAQRAWISAAYTNGRLTDGRLGRLQ